MHVVRPSPVPDVPAHPRRVILVSLDWTRDKDPRIPLGHASILAALQQAGVQVRGHSFPLNAPDFSEAFVLETILEDARELPPEQVDVGFGAYVWNDGCVKALLRALRQRGFRGRLLLGGPQVSYSGPGLERLYPEVDAFVRGYGEEAMVALATSAEPRAFPGVHWAGRTDLGLQAQARLDVLPSPFLEGRVDVSQGQRFIRWETQRGCPFRCSFCQHREAGERMRRRALPFERLEREMELFVRSGVEDIAVLDPLFNLGPHALAVLECFQRLGYRGRLSLQCHFSTLDAEFLDACAGLDVRLEFGLQTIHDAEARAVERVNRMEKVHEGLRELRARRIPFEVSVIFGLPAQTLESFRQTVDFCLRMGVPTLKAFPLMLLRGTGLERERERWGLVENEDVIPCVIRSHTFDEEDWRRMAALSDALRRTEGRHPPGVDALERWMGELPRLTGRWSPALRLEAERAVP